MAVSLSVVVAKDGAGTTIAGGLQAQDKSGAGTGPFTLGHILIDGLAGVNMAAVTAANAAKVDGSAVTQPVSNAGTFAVQVSNANANGRALPANSAPVVMNSMTYQTVAASTTQQCGATGASGDYLDGVLIIPGTAAAGIVQIKDASGSAITIFAGGGTTALPTLAPFYVPIGAVATGVGGWKVITLANETAIAIGNFT